MNSQNIMVVKFFENNSNNRNFSDVYIFRRILKNNCGVNYEEKNPQNKILIFSGFGGLSRLFAKSWGVQVRVS